MIMQNTIRYEIERHFQFLFDKGFEILSFEYYPRSFGDWKMTFKSTGCLVQIYSDRGEVNIVLSPLEPKRWFGLSTIMFFVSKGQEFMGFYEGDLSDKSGQLEWLARLFNMHLESILHVIVDDFQKNYDDLLESESVLLTLYKEKFRLRSIVDKEI